MKVFKWIVIVVLVLIIGGALLLYANLNRIVKSTVESQGTQQLNVPTTLDGVSLGLFQGTVSLNNLNVGSPQGFNAPQMLSVGGLSVDTGGLSNLRKEPLHVSSIRVDNPKLVIEQQDLKINFKELMDHLPSQPDKNPPQQSGQSKPVRLIIDDLNVNGAQVIVRPGIPGISQEINIPIPQIDVKNIGNADGAQNGAAIKDVVTTLITQMVTKAADSDKLPPEVKALLAGNLDAVKDKLTSAAKGELNKATDQLKAKLPGAAGDLINQLGNPNSQPPVNGQPAPNPTQNLLNEGFGALKDATSKPSK